jgi:hypothetical protein
LTTDLATVAPNAVSDVVARWAHLYNNAKVVSTAVTFVHFAGVLLGGGFAVVADRDAFRLSRQVVTASSGPLDNFAEVHVWVIGGLCCVFVSGLLMMLADLHTYATSSVFWAKMGLVALLLGNGYGRMRAEAAARHGTAAAWTWLRRTSVASLVLWFAVLLVSTILTAIS